VVRIRHIGNRRFSSWSLQARLVLTKAGAFPNPYENTL